MKKIFLLLMILAFNSCKAQKNDTNRYAVLNKNIEYTNQKRDSLPYIYYRSIIDKNSSFEYNHLLLLGQSRFIKGVCDKEITKQFQLKDSTFFKNQIKRKYIFWDKSKLKNNFSNKFITYNDIKLKNEINIENLNSLEENYKGRNKESAIETFKIRLWEKENQTKLSYLPFPFFSKNKQYAFIFDKSDLKGKVYKKNESDWDCKCVVEFRSSFH